MARFVSKLNTFKERVDLRDDLLPVGHDFNGEIRAFPDAMVYDLDVGVVLGRIRILQEMVAGNPWLREVFPFDAQLFLSPAVAFRLPRREEWGAITGEYLRAKILHVQGLTDGDVMEAMTAVEDEAVALYEGWGAGQPAEQPAIAYLTVGSHNQDIRGKVLDGEALYVVSGSSAMSGYLDFVGLMGETTWVRTIEELSALIPSHSGFWRWVGRHIRIAL